jgi:hypothetical protein
MTHADLVRQDPHPTMTISPIRDVLNLIATLLAGISIAGLLFVVLFLFQGERGSSVAQSRRREE